MDPKANQTKNSSLSARHQEFLNPSRRKSDYLERRALTAAMKAMGQHLDHGRVLDVGCGLKPYESILAADGDTYLGIDYPVTMEHSYDQATRADVFGDCQKLPFQDGHFDSVISTQVLEHVPEPGLLIREMARVLKPEGVLLLSAPMVWPLHEEPYDYYRYTIHGLRYLLQQATFEIIAEISRGHSAATLGQTFLNLQLAGRPINSLVGKVYSNLLCLLVNSVCGPIDRWFKNPRICLGIVISARKKGISTHGD